MGGDVVVVFSPNVSDHFFPKPVCLNLGIVASFLGDLFPPPSHSVRRRSQCAHGVFSPLDQCLGFVRRSHCRGARLTSLHRLGPAARVADGRAESQTRVL